MKKKVTIILRIISKAILTILLTMIVILATYVIYIKIMQKQNKLDSVPFNMYVILTQSMSPKIKAGDMIVTYKEKDNNYEVGDIVTYVSDGTYTQGVTITHRIVKTTLRDGEKAYVTKGDANNTEDSPAVLTKNVMGKVIIKIPKVGYIQQFLVTKFGWIVAIVLPCMGIIIFDFVKIFTRRKQILDRKNSIQNVNSINSTDDNDVLSKISIKENVKPDNSTKKENIEKREKDGEEDFWGTN